MTIYSLAVSPDGRFLVAAGGNPYHYGPAHEGGPATVHVYDLPGLTLRRTLAGHWDKANGRRVPAGRQAARHRRDRRTGHDLGRPDLAGAADLREASPRTNRDGPRSWPGARTAVGSPSASRRASGSWTRKPDTTARIAERSRAWPGPGGRRIAAITGPAESRSGTPRRARLGPPLKAGGVVRRLFWARSGQRLTGFCTDGTRTTWDLATGRVVEDKAVVPGLGEVVSSPDGSFYVTGGNDGLLRGG